MNPTRFVLTCSCDFESDFSQNPIQQATESKIRVLLRKEHPMLLEHAAPLCRTQGKANLNQISF